MNRHKVSKDGYKSQPLHNEDVAFQDQAHSTLGDIDVRKIYLTIDTSKFEKSFRSPNYVVRDLWHPATTWLVQADSQFAVYIKPGDAKFLYIEKGVAAKESEKLRRH